MNIINNLDKYAEWLRDSQNLSPTSLITYQKAIRKYGNDLELESLLRLVKKIVQRLEPTTCHTYVAALSSYAKFQNIQLDWSKIHRLIPSKTSKFYDTISDQELELLKKARFEKTNWFYQRNGLILDFLFYTGVRISELVNLKHRDYQNKQLRILGKGNKIRYIFLAEFLIKYIKPASRGYLFATQEGGRINPENIRQHIRKKAKLAGINKPISPHTFRRSFATNSYNCEVRLETIQKQLGHTNINTTLSYIHNDFNSLYEDISKLWKNRSTI
jgi:integrase/recombinase XerD